MTDETVAEYIRLQGAESQDDDRFRISEVRRDEEDAFLRKRPRRFLRPGFVRAVMGDEMGTGFSENAGRRRANSLRRAGQEHGLALKIEHGWGSGKALNEASTYHETTFAQPCENEARQMPGRPLKTAFSSMGIGRAGRAAIG